MVLWRILSSAYIERGGGRRARVAQLVRHLLLDGDAEQGAQIHQGPLDLVPARLKVYVFHWNVYLVHFSLI